jgi:HAD superfamily hydrolase (TIGR01509 family)
MREVPTQVPEVAPLDVYELATAWRGAFDAAESALDTGRRFVPPAELSAHRQLLGAERASTLELLKAVAREHGVTTTFLHLLPRRDLRNLLALPAQVTACVFELDGVLVLSAELHVAAWQETFDALLARRRGPLCEDVAPFARTDYARHIHGKPRLEGVLAFLESRGISLPPGRPDDPPGRPTVHGLANLKNEVLVDLIEERDVRSFEDSRRYLETAVEAGLRTAVVSASANSDRLLARAGLAGLVDACVDGRTMVTQHLGKRPDPDVLLAACRQLGVQPQASASFETTSAGVAAARAADFAVVFAVDRGSHADALRAAGADVVTPDLGVLLERRLAA